MSSILTNNGAMVALQTMTSINNDLTDIQGQISTGLEVSSAKDNSSVWAISKVMESDVKGFQGISDSLALGESTLSVASNAAETVTDLLTEIKGKVVAAQEENVDREKIQTDIDALTSQIESVVGAAQFNGLNLVKGTDDMNVLSSLDRGADGTVSASDITVTRQDLSTDAGVYGSGTSLTSNTAVSEGTIDSSGVQNQMELTFAGASADALELTVNGTSLSIAFDTDDATTAANAASAINALGLTGVSASDDGSGMIQIQNTNSFQEMTVTWDPGATNTVAFDNNDGDTGAAATGAASSTLVARAEEITLSTSAQVKEGDSYRASVNGNDYDYIAGKGENMEDVALGLKAAIDGGAEDGVTTNVTQDDTTGAWAVQVDYEGSGTITLAAAGQEDGTASGGLFGMSDIDVTTNAGADAALANVETLINNSIDAAAEFGSAQGRMETQSEFISSLTDSLQSGIGSMVDADMEEASAKLQALQVQQQLGVQALSIANSTPQTILSLFG